MPGGGRLRQSQSRRLQLRVSAGCTGGPPRPGRGRPGGSAGRWIHAPPTQLDIAHSVLPAQSSITFLYKIYTTGVAPTAILQISLDMRLSENLQKARRATTAGVSLCVVPLHTVQLVHVQIALQNHYHRTL